MADPFPYNTNHPQPRGFQRQAPPARQYTPPPARRVAPRGNPLDEFAREIENLPTAIHVMLILACLFFALKVIHDVKNNRFSSAVQEQRFDMRHQQRPANQTHSFRFCR